MNLRQFFERYGVSLGVIAVLALLIAIIPGNSTTSNQVSTSSNAPLINGAAAPFVTSQGGSATQTEVVNTAARG